MRSAAAQPSVLAKSDLMPDAPSLPGHSCSTKLRVSSKLKRSVDASISSRLLRARSRASGSAGSVRVQTTTCTCDGAFSMKNDIGVVNRRKADQVIVVEEQIDLVVDVDEFVDQRRHDGVCGHERGLGRQADR